MDAADQQRHTATLAHASKVDSGREAGWEMRRCKRKRRRILSVSCGMQAAIGAHCAGLGLREIVAASYASKQMPPGSPSAAALLPSTTLTPES